MGRSGYYSKQRVAKIPKKVLAKKKKIRMLATYM